VIVTFIWAVVFLGRLVGPPTLADDDQERPAAYIVDVLRNGNWIVQVDDTGDVTSKPPMYTWLAALSAMAWGHLDLFSLYVPCALAVLGVAWMVLAVGWRRFGPMAGLIGALAFLVSLPSFLMVNLARTDPVFMFFVVASALLMWRLWETGRGAFGFWVVATLATLTKGPLGLLLVLGGLLALAWERWRPGEGPRPAGILSRPLGHVAGIALYVGINVGWLLLAKSELGDAVTDKLIGQELGGHATRSSEGAIPFSKFYQPTPLMMLRFLPWSIASAIGVWWVFRHPSRDAVTRRFERFLVALLLFGLLIFSIAPHQRHVHLLPLMFAMALLAGRVIDGWLEKKEWYVVNWKTGMAFLAISLVCLLGYNVSRGLGSRGGPTRTMFDLADQSHKALGSTANVGSLDATFAFQFHANTHIPRIDTWRANSMLASPEATYVAVENWKRFEQSLWEPHVPLYRFGMTPDVPFGTDEVEIVSNRPTFDLQDDHVAYIGDIRVMMYGAVLLDVGPLNHLTLHATKPEGRVLLKNDTVPEKTVHLRIVNADDASEHVIEILPWHTHEIPFTAKPDRLALPDAPPTPWARRGVFLFGLAGVIAVGAWVTRRALVQDNASA
jgi:hypothetical protein